jgi:hypothetical protein
MISIRTPKLALSALLLGFVACGGETPPAVAPPTTATPPPSGVPTTAATGAEKRPEAGHNLAIMAAACWFGGVWGDAEGDTDTSRAQASEARCHDVVRRVYDNDDKVHYEQLRAIEPGVVGDIAGKVETLAKDDPDDAPRSQTLAALVQNVAAAQREAMVARRAAGRVRRDIAKEPDKLSDDEAAAVPQLKDTRNLEALLKMDAGDITHDAHALGMLAALERVSIARNLPKHMKIYAVGGVHQVLFGVAPPAVPDDATKPLKPGTWLAYMTDVAKAAGHPVAASAKTPKQKEPLAWVGMLEGYADKLRADIDGLAKDTRLHHVSSVVVQRLDAEYKAEVNALTGPPAQPAPKGGPAATPATAPAPKK